MPQDPSTLEPTDPPHLVTLPFDCPPVRWSGKFDRLEVQRARLSRNGPWEWLTTRAAVAARPAPLRLVFLPGQLRALIGTTLVLQGATTQSSVTFTPGVNGYLLPSEVVSQVLLQAGGWLEASFDPFPLSFSLQPIAAGSAASLSVSGSALTFFSVAEHFSAGQDPAPYLQPGVWTYLLDDPFSTTTSWYRFRYAHTVSGVSSEWSLPFLANGPPLVVKEQVVTGYAQIIDGQGRPSSGRQVLLETSATGTVNGHTLLPLRLDGCTDKNGRVEFILLRGVTYRVAVLGSSTIREGITPTDTAVLSFDLFGPQADFPDVFTVQQPIRHWGLRTA